MHARLHLTLLVATLASTACDGALFGGLSSHNNADDAADTCAEPLTMFERETWPTVFRGHCYECHQERGMAALRPTVSFELEAAHGPDFVERNFDMVASFAADRSGDYSLIWAKAMGYGHGGGVVLGDDEVAQDALKRFLAVLEDDSNHCDATQTHDQRVDDVRMPKTTRLGLAETLREATLTVLGRLPTQQEYSEVQRGAESGLRGRLRALLNDDPGLEDFIKEAFNDRLHTRKYVYQRDNNEPFRELFGRSEQYPGVNTAFNQMSRTDRRNINADLGEGTLELVWHVVRTGRPFSEVLTADFMMLTQPTAQLLGAEMEAGAWDDGDAYAPGRLIATVDGVATPFPHSGLVNEPAHLGRWPSNASNRNRARANSLYTTFLNADVLEMSQRSADASATTYEIPTVQDPLCVVCHTVLDPAAGSLSVHSLDFRRAADLRDGAAWPQELRAPGFEHESLPPERHPDGPQWLAERLADTRDFDRGALRLVFEAAIGHPPLDYPRGVIDSDDSAQQLRAWRTQQAWMEVTIDDYRANGRDLRDLIADVLASDWFRATRVDAPHLRPIMGSASLHTPEQLERRLDAVLGIDHKLLHSVGVRTTLGGVNSSDTLARVRAPSAVMAGVLDNLAYDASCRAVGADFARTDRVLSPQDLSAEDALPLASEDVSDELRVAVAELHWRVLGLHLEPHDPEVDQAIDLLLAIAEQGRDDIANGRSRNLPGECRASGVKSDKHYTIRAWAGVVAALLMDPRFLQH